jgi:hypothetical protein
MSRRVALPILIGAALCSPSLAFAQSKEDVARADALFAAAKALTDAGNYADACAKFAESKRLAPGLGVTLYLADCYERTGRTASAWTEFRSAEGLARERNDKRADVAHERAQALEPKLDRLTITLAPSIPRDGLQILRDGRVVPGEELGLPVPVDPGEHTVVVSGPGRNAKTLTARLGPDQPSAVIDIDGLEPASVPATPAVPPAPTTSALAPGGPSPAPPPVSADGGGATTRRWMGVGVGGAGVVGLGVGAVLGLLAKGQLDQSNQPGGCDATDHCSAQGLSDRKAAEGLATGATVALVAGGAALAAGAVLYLTAPRGASKVGVVVAPVPAAGGGGALVRVTF